MEGDVPVGHQASKRLRGISAKLRVPYQDFSTSLVFLWAWGLGGVYFQWCICSFQSPGGETVQKEYSTGKRGGCSVCCGLCLPTMLLSSLPFIAGGRDILSVDYFSLWPPGQCCSASVSLFSLCGNQRLPPHTVQCLLPLLEALKKEVGLDLPLLATIQCGLCQGSFQRLSPVFTSWECSFEPLQ